jgi:hypothetical protein
MLDMQSNDVIEVVTPLGGGISEVTLFPDTTAALAGTAGTLSARQLNNKQGDQL